MTKVKAFPADHGETMGRTVATAIAAAEQDFLDAVSVYGPDSAEAVTASMVLKRRRQAARNRMVLLQPLSTEPI